MNNSILTPPQTKVRDLIQSYLATTTDTKAYLVALDKQVNDTKSVYYLDKPVESKLYIDSEITTTPEDLKRLFKDGITLPNLKTKYIKKYYKGYGIPFRGILTNNLSTVIAKQDFKGEPFLRGKFHYMEVILPPRTSTLKELFSRLPATLNGFKVCDNPTKESLIELTRDILNLFPEKKHLFNVERIVDRVLEETHPFNGNQKYTDIIWNPDYTFTGKEKSKIFSEYSGKAKRNKTFELLQKSYIEGMTQKQLWEKVNTSESTVKRYWKSLQVGQLADKKTGFLKVA